MPVAARRHSWLYRWYLDSPVWRLRRWWWWLTSDRACERCGRPLVLHRRELVPSAIGQAGDAAVLTVHHKTYARLGHERRADVELLCWPCHKRGDAWRHPRFA